MGTITEDQGLRDRTGVFRDREDAGDSLASFIQERFTFTSPVVCPVPAGGIPIGVRLAVSLNAPLMPAIVRKIQIPWNRESGFGAVAWNGHTLLNQDLVMRLGLSREDMERAIAGAKVSVEERIRKFSGSKPHPRINGSTAILTDDGLASGYTMRAAGEALRLQNPARVVVAVPTGSLSALRRVSEIADDLICLNIRGGIGFAVADAYVHWHDLTDDEVHSWLNQAIHAGLF
jgi:predicted phosphoribosyltransferase